MTLQTDSTPRLDDDAMPEVNRQMLVILDFGSQYSELIARRIRETEVYSEVLSYRTTAEQLKQLNPKGIILSGGPSSVYDTGAPHCDPAIWELGIPILGVCYGMQLMVQQLGGQVERAERGEYGKAGLFIDDPTDLLTNVEDNTTMWMSHGDSVTRLPDGFEVLAHTDNTPCAAIADHSRKLYGVQFHPEVVHSLGGIALIRNFVYHICECQPTWTTEAFVEEAIREVRARVGGKRVLLALSGGVDSSTLAFLLHEAIGDQLTCMFIDQGFMRKGEPEAWETMARVAAAQRTGQTGTAHDVERRHAEGTPAKGQHAEPGPAEPKAPNRYPQVGSATPNRGTNQRRDQRLMARKPASVSEPQRM